MTISFRDKIVGAFLFSFLALLFTGCAARQAATQNVVMTEYFLDKAGFQQWPVNDTTPKRQAFVQAIPKEKITAFERGGQNYYAYTDVAAQRLYVGDEAAYQKFLSISQGRKLCERVTAPDSSQFWSCYDEYQSQTGGRPRGQ